MRHDADQWVSSVDRSNWDIAPTLWSLADLSPHNRDVGFSPESGHRQAAPACLKSAMCGRLRVGKSFLHVLQHWSVQPCVRSFNEAHMTAGHNALRGSGPDQQQLAFKNAPACVFWHSEPNCAGLPFADAFGGKLSAEDRGARQYFAQQRPPTPIDLTYDTSANARARGLVNIAVYVKLRMHHGHVRCKKAHVHDW